MTIGFAQEWLASHDRRLNNREINFRQTQIFWSRWMAWAATVTGTIAAIGLALQRGASGKLQQRATAGLMTKDEVRGTRDSEIHAYDEA